MVRSLYVLDVRRQSPSSHCERLDLCSRRLQGVCALSPKGSPQPIFSSALQTQLDRKELDSFEEIDPHDTRNNIFAS